MNLSKGRPTYSIGIHILENWGISLSRPSNRVVEGLSASVFVVLMSQTALAGIDVHVSMPTIHISVPTVHVSAPIVQVQAPILIKTAKTKGTAINSSALHRDHQDSGSDRWGHNTPVVIATNRGTTGGIAVYGTTYVPPGRDLPKGGRNGGSQTTSKGVSVVTLDIPGTSGRDRPRGGTGTGSSNGTGSPGLKVITGGSSIGSGSPILDDVFVPYRYYPFGQYDPPCPVGAATAQCIASGGDDSTYAAVMASYPPCRI